jgi:hypothetical protein
MPNRTLIPSVILLAVAPLAVAQVATAACHKSGQIKLEADTRWSYAAFTYHLSDPRLFSAAWLEVWDRPQRLSRKQVPLKTQGRIDWEPKEDPPETPAWLLIGIPDESGVVAGATDVLIGGIRGLGGPSPKVWPGQSFSFQQGSDAAHLTIRAGILSPITDFLLAEQESAAVWIAREYLTGRLVDLEHVQVEIPAGYLSRPTALKLEPIPRGLIAPGNEIAPDPDSIAV